MPLIKWKITQNPTALCIQKHLRNDSAIIKSFRQTEKFINHDKIKREKKVKNY